MQDVQARLADRVLLVSLGTLGVPGHLGMQGKMATTVHVPTGRTTLLQDPMKHPQILILVPLPLLLLNLRRTFCPPRRRLSTPLPPTDRSRRR
ncbi:MAG: hypothetical protein GY696_02165 [Gammaproteobacteria bacterium]|nr:hypothetical protein [Gammaproteobacteria bacterium]